MVNEDLVSLLVAVLENVVKLIVYFFLDSLMVTHFSLFFCSLFPKDILILKAMVISIGLQGLDPVS